MSGPLMQSTPSKRYQQLQPEDRVSLTSLAHQMFSVRAMAQVLGSSPSTIKREMLRNTQPAGYTSNAARARAMLRHRQGRAPTSSITMAFCSSERTTFWASAGRLNRLPWHWPASSPKVMSTACHTRQSTTASTSSLWASSSAR